VVKKLELGNFMS